MFNFITDAIENTLDVADSLISGEDVTKKQIAKLISDGLSVYAISSATGLAVDVIQKYIED
jgi:hypothetical protein